MLLSVGLLAVLLALVAGTEAALLILAAYLAFHLIQLARFLSGKSVLLVGFWPWLQRSWKQTQWRRERRMRRLARQLARDEAVLDALPVGLVQLDGEGDIQRFNRTAGEILGLRRQDCGTPIRHLLRLPEFVRWLAGGEDILRLVMPEARLRVLALEKRPLDHGLLLLVRDITTEADVARLRRDFVANASHELRTPVTVFRGYLETLLALEEPALQPVRPALEQMAQQAERMHAIIEDLLTLSSLEQGMGRDQRERVDMTALMETLCQEAVQLSANQHVLVFECETEHDLRGNRSVLHSIFSNLISNAVRYTPEGGRIEVRWRLNEAGEGVFEVSDTGIGIPREHIPRLTERFYRVDTARSRESGGTGLGLAIVRHGLEMHRGRLEVDSTPQVGSTFRAIFPAKAVT
ncbi:phosphate regulon sensor histidine kinase PhoR [Sulfurivirga sp.]|uniref:phosphate regulon sensor histidine kinase PhoR n=1 Tax=Sulfurivirga sp. TaxID=2614236 RepID=UPI0025CE7B45|nr:phosphate regulon sensor histidine kinase PhoR [Sulfurivirga sp.]